MLAILIVSAALISPSLLLAAEQALAELQLQVEIISAQQDHAAEAIERGKLQIEAGTLRQALGRNWAHELKQKRAEIEAKIKTLTGAQKKP